MAEESIREQIARRLGELKQERSSFIPHWRELTDFLSPRTGRYLVIDRNKGVKANDKIINSCAPRSGAPNMQRGRCRLATPSLGQPGSIVYQAFAFFVRRLP